MHEKGTHCLPVFSMRKNNACTDEELEFFNDISENCIAPLQSHHSELDDENAKIRPETALQTTQKEKAWSCMFNLDDVATWENEVIPEDWLPDALTGLGITFKDGADHNGHKYSEIGKDGKGVWRTMRYYIARFWTEDLENEDKQKMAAVLREAYPSTEKNKPARSKKAKKTTDEKENFFHEKASEAKDGELFPAPDGKKDTGPVFDNHYGRD
jgi:hypothetical protein